MIHPKLKLDILNVSVVMQPACCEYIRIRLQSRPGPLKCCAHLWNKPGQFVWVTGGPWRAEVTNLARKHYLEICASALSHSSLEMRTKACLAEEQTNSI